MLIIRGLTASEKLAVWDVDCEVIKTCGKTRLKALLNDNPVPWKVLGSSFRVFVKGVLGYKGNKLPSF